MMPFSFQTNDTNTHDDEDNDGDNNINKLTILKKSLHQLKTVTEILIIKALLLASKKRS